MHLGILLTSTSPDLIALTTAFSIEAYAYENSDEALVPALGVIGILLNSGVHLEDAALDHARFLEQHSAPGLSNMIPYWKPGLRASARMAYIGVLLSLLSSVRDLAIAIYKEVGREAATILPLKHLFGLGMGEWDHDSSTYSHPYLSLVPNMKNVARLKTTGANISFLCLGLAHLEHLETNLVQETATMGRTNYVNTMCELHSFSLPEVRSLTMHIVWQGLLHKSDYDIVQFFETCHLPQLSNLNINITQGNLRTDGLPAGSIDSLLESIKPVSHYLQEFNLSVTCNGLSPRSHD
jgi:hypothetical protein